MTIRTKLTLLICAIILMVACAIVVQRDLEVKRLASLFESSRREKQVVFDKVVSLKDSRLKVFVNDYSFQGDVADFISNGNKERAITGIDPSLSNFDINAIWIYGAGLSPLYYAGNFRDGDVKELPVPRDAVKRLFAKDSFCNFFAKTDMGLMEIRGAAVYPSSDRERKTKPAGYLFAGFLWDKSFLDELSVVTGSRVRFTPIYEKKNPGTASDIANGESSFMKDLTDWEGKPVAKLAVLFRSEGVRLYNQTGQTAFYIFAFFSVAILFILLLLLVRWVTTPLKQISVALNKEDPSFLNKIKDNRDEFGDIAKVISKFFEQSDALKSENIERRKIEFQERAILDNIPDIAWLKDKEGKFIAVNGAFAKSCGAEPEELVGKTDFDVWPKEFAERYTADDKEVMLWGKRKLVTEPLFSVDGDLAWIETIKTPIHNEKGEVIGTTGIARDVTERKKAEEELKKAYVELKEVQHRLIQAEKYAALGKFSSAFAHEIKNPLSTILNGIEFLETRLEKGEPDIKEDLEIIKKSTLRADNIIQRLLKFARPTSVNPEKMKSEDLVKDTLTFFKYSSPTSEIRINTEFSEDKMYVEVDRNQMQQAIVNLILNAAESMPKGGDILIKTYKVERSEFYFAKPACVIEISDNGYGIPEENLSKIFEPFFTTKSEKGTGLGLFITKLIIDSNKGNMVIDSRVGKGTSVKIVLPEASPL